MAAIERTYTIPLRREWLKTVKYKRAKKAVRAIREFLMRHMKATEENVKLGKYLNLELWKHSIKSPPSRVKVNVVKDDKGVVKAEIVGAPKETPKVEAPKKPAAKKEETTPATKPTEEKKAEPAKKESTQTKPAAPKAPAQPVPAKQPAAQKQQTGQMVR